MGHRNAVALTTIHPANNVGEPSRRRTAVSWEVLAGLTFKVPDKAAGRRSSTTARAPSAAIGLRHPRAVRGGKTPSADALAGRIDGKRKGRTLRETSRAASAAPTSSRRTRSSACSRRRRRSTPRQHSSAAPRRQRQPRRARAHDLRGCYWGRSCSRASAAARSAACPCGRARGRAEDAARRAGERPRPASALGVLEKVRDVAGRAAVAVILTIHRVAERPGRPGSGRSWRGRAATSATTPASRRSSRRRARRSPIGMWRVCFANQRGFSGHGDLEAIVAKFRETRGDRSGGPAPPPRRRAGF